jgi:hypothetical protein
MQDSNKAYWQAKVGKDNMHDVHPKRSQTAACNGNHQPNEQAAC